MAILELVPSCLYISFMIRLVKVMPEGLYTPSLAESWTVSPDAKVYEFKLRKGVKFHNGDTMTAEDVVFSFWRYKGTNAKMILGKTEKVEAVNPHLVRIPLQGIFSRLSGFPYPWRGHAWLDRAQKICGEGGGCGL